jgi:YidC/Oxa1 family membrane protein insertase
MDENNRNFLLAIILSIGVLFAWQFFYGVPKQHQQEALKQSTEQQQPGVPGPPRPQGEAPLTPGPSNGAPRPDAAPGGAMTREQALAMSPRIPIDTPSLEGSIALKGGRIDDLVLKKYRETVEPGSPNEVLLSPAGSPHPYYAEHGFVGGSTDADLGLPTADTLWKAETNGPLTPTSPVTLTYDNGKGLTFTRTVGVDENYMFTIDDKVANTGTEAATVYPYGLVSRHERPQTKGYYILHEGLIGVADNGVDWCGTFVASDLCEITYKKAIDKTNAPLVFKSTSGWLGITDKYWAAVVIPEQGKAFEARFAGTTATDGRERFQTDYLEGPLAIAPGATGETKGFLFAGAKEVHVVDGYGAKYGIQKFDLLIDWGWFYFLTKPMFFALDYFYKLVGNFGIAILIVTFIIKLVLFPLANKSYVSMSKMKKLQPEIARLKERYGDDRMRQQQGMMELYKKEKVNPASGCLPILVQVPVFFALYKVLFVTIEMRQAPFFGWIKDLSAPDPTTVFNLFGLIPWTPPDMLMIGVWPLIMGTTMWVQMRLNPAPPDPVQQKVFAWMPVFFTFLLARFPAGLVIYWAWNNSLSVVQQSVIMSRQGVAITLFDNIGLKKLKGIRNRRGKSETKSETSETES